MVQVGPPQVAGLLHALKGRDGGRAWGRSTGDNSDGGSRVVGAWGRRAVWTGPGVLARAAADKQEQEPHAHSHDEENYNPQHLLYSPCARHWVATTLPYRDKSRQGGFPPSFVLFAPDTGCGAGMDSAIYLLAVVGRRHGTGTLKTHECSDTISSRHGVPCHVTGGRREIIP